MTDELNQLTRSSGSDGTVYKYFYYDGGNLHYKILPDGTRAYYTYDSTWKDLLVSYGGQSITYDAIGNPLTYRDSMSFTWSGRQMSSAVANSTTTYYTYDIDGIRTKKVVGGVTTDYFVNGSTILAEKTGNNVIWYIYDSSDEILGFTYNDTPYYYIKNLQGDVVSVIDANGTIVASYTYDPWGKVVSATGTMASINPIRYRGYYYDNETGLYYLNSRYYDPEIGRFINADYAAYLGANGTIPSFNLFAYCVNNPIMGYDPNGYLDASVLRLTQSISISALFATYASGLYTALAATLTKISLYVTGILLPKIAALFWWQPWLVAGIVVAAVAVVITAVTVYRNKQLDKVKSSISNKIKLKNGKIDLNKFSKKPGSGPPRWIGPLGYELVKDMSEHKGKAYKLFKLGVRIATIALDGTILGE